MRGINTNNNNEIAVTIDTGQQADMFTGQPVEVEIKRNCKLIKPTLFDYERESKFIKEIKQ